MDEDEADPFGETAVAVPLVEQSTHVASGGDSLDRRIQRVMEEGLVMGGVPRERKLDVSEKSFNIGYIYIGHSI